MSAVVASATISAPCSDTLSRLAGGAVDCPQGHDPDHGGMETGLRASERSPASFSSGSSSQNSGSSRPYSVTVLVRRFRMSSGNHQCSGCAAGHARQAVRFSTGKSFNAVDRPRGLMLSRNICRIWSFFSSGGGAGGRLTNASPEYGFGNPARSLTASDPSGRARAQHGYRATPGSAAFSPFASRRDHGGRVTSQPSVSGTSRRRHPVP